MNYFHLLLCIPLGLPLVAGAQVQTDCRKLTLMEADSLLMANNPTLKWKAAEVRAAEGEWKQSRAGENPEIALLHNVKNPENGRYFDCGKTGETDVQVSQRLFIGGQRKQAVRRSAALKRAAESDQLWTQRELRTLLVKTMLTLDGLVQKEALFAVQTAMFDRIVAAHTTVAREGNISPLELSKLQAMAYLAAHNRRELQTARAEQEELLQLLLGIDDKVVPVVPELDSLTLTQVMMAERKVDDRPDLQQAKQQVDAANHEIRLQQAQALPEVNLTAEWDKNGSIGHNFFAIGATLTLPLAHRNKGNIALAKARHLQAQIEAQQRRDEAAAAIRRWTEQVRLLWPLTRSASVASQRELLQQAERQYLQRHLSMTDFATLVETFTETMNTLIDNKVNLGIATEELKKAKGL